MYKQLEHIKSTLNHDLYAFNLFTRYDKNVFTKSINTCNDLNNLFLYFFSFGNSPVLIPFNTKHTF